MDDKPHSPTNLSIVAPPILDGKIKVENVPCGLSMKDNPETRQKPQ